MIGITGPWQHAALGALGHWQGGKTPSKRVSAYWTGGTIPWVSPKDFGPEIITTSQDSLTQRALDDTGIGLVPEDALLLVTRSSILKHSLPTAVTGEPVSINQDVKALLPAPGISARFLQLQLEAVVDDILEHTVKSGTTVESVDFAALKRSFAIIPLPEEQERVVREVERLLAALEGGRAAVAGALNRLDDVWAAALAGAFSGALTASWRATEDVDHEWQSVTLGSVVEALQYGSSSKSQRSGTIPVLRMGNIQRGRLEWSDLVYTSDPKEIKKYCLQDGDVLFNRTNSPELVGKTAVYHAERPAIAAGYLIAVRCGPRIMPDLLAHFLNSPAGRAYCWSVKSDGVSQSNINARKLAAFTFNLPPLAEQNQILEKLKYIAERIALTRERLGAVESNLATLRRRIVQAAFQVGTEPDTNSSELEALLSEAREFKPATIAKENGERRAMKASMKLPSQITALIASKGPNGTSFEDIQQEIPAEYDALKAEIFALLQSTTPPFDQVFDALQGVIRLRAAEQ